MPTFMQTPDPAWNEDAPVPSRWLHDPPASASFDPLEITAADERITGHERVSSLIGALVRQQGPAWLRIDRDLRVPVRALRSEGSMLVVERALEWLPSSLIVEWTGHNSLFRARAMPSGHDRAGLPLRMLGFIDRVQQRVFRRVLQASDVQVRFHRDSDGSGDGRRQDGGAPGRLLALRDLSTEGISVWLADLCDVPSPGGAANLITVIGSDGPPIELRAEVRSIGGTGPGARPFAGLRVRPASRRDALEWLLFLERQLHPRVLTTPAAVEQLWPLLQDAGYLRLSGKAPSDFEERRAKFVDATRRSLDAPSVGLLARWPESGAPLATLSALRLYENAWLGFQMVKITGSAPDGTSSRLVLREIHLSVYERIQRDPGARWIVGHTQVRPVWSRLVHHDLTARFVATGEAAIWRFRAIEMRAPVAVEIPKGVSVGFASSEEQLRVLRSFAQQRPEALLEALDLVPSRFDLPEVRRRWWVGGLERERRLLVARRAGVVAAAMVLELADEGLHLFRLLDCGLPITLAPDGDSCVPALVAAADEWYRGRGRLGWVCYFDAQMPAPPIAGSFDMGEADMCVLSTARMPEFFEHLHEMTAPRLAGEVTVLPSEP